MYLKKCVIYSSVSENNFLYNLFKKHQLLHLCHTYCTVLYERHSGKFFQQLMKIKGFKYFEHSN